MKKAYVKPVLYAEEYEMSGSVAACALTASVPRELIYGVTNVCSSTHGGNDGCGAGKIDQESNWNQYLEYATDDKTTYDILDKDENKWTVDNSKVYLFTGSTIECDYIWNSNGDKEKVQKWNTSIVAERLQAGFSTLFIGDTSFSLSGFLCGNEWTGSGGHDIGYMGQKTFS